jgi:hypothetical protein
MTRTVVSQKYMCSIRVSFRRLLALALITSVTLSGCESTRPIHYSHPELRERARPIESLALVALDVSVFHVGFGDVGWSDEWTDAARTNLRKAMATHFGRDLWFPEAVGNRLHQKELEQVRDLMEWIVPEQVKGKVACLPGPVLRLADAAGADTLLLVYARDRIPTAATRVGIVALLALAVAFIPLLLLFPPFWGAAPLPDVGSQKSFDLRIAELNTITLCLVDARGSWTSR